MVRIMGLGLDQSQLGWLGLDQGQLGQLGQLVLDQDQIGISWDQIRIRLELGLYIINQISHAQVLQI